MWQSPSQRVRAAANARKRAKERNRSPLHIKRVLAQLKVLTTPGTQPMITEARVVLNDMTCKGVGLFSVCALNPGQQVAITMEEPKRIYLRGMVTWCQEFDVDSHILSQHSYSFRIGIKFTFESEKEEEAFKKFCEEIGKEHLFTDAA